MSDSPISQYEFYLITKQEIADLRSRAVSNHGGPDVFDRAADELEMAARVGSDFYAYCAEEEEEARP
jgi:hypothetical protein